MKSYVFDVIEDSRVGEVRRCANLLTDELSFTEARASRVAIVVSELSTNLYRHAVSGRILLRAAAYSEEAYLEIIAIDRGPGIDDLDRSFIDGVTTSTTLGGGLGAIRRQSDLFDIETSSKGTIIVCEIHASDESAALAKASKFRVAGVCVPVEPETVSGDAWIARKTLSGVEILAVDGLGHGPIAHVAAKTALDNFARLPVSTPLGVTLQSLHNALRPTRGAAVSLADLIVDRESSKASIDFSGVGNVRGVICEPKREKTLLTHPGTAGLQYRPKPVLRTEWSGDGAFVMHSDGLQTRWGSAEIATYLGRHPGILAGALFRDYTRGTDDVSVVAMSFFDWRRT